jgi:hypothetical protein
MAPSGAILRIHVVAGVMNAAAADTFDFQIEDSLSSWTHSRNAFATGSPLDS